MGEATIDDSAIADNGKSAALASTPRPSMRTRVHRVFRELLAISFWGYLVSKVFFFDLDYWLISTYSPQLRWIVDYRFLWFVLVLGVVVFLASRLRALGLVLYVSFYPFVLLFWRLPWLLMRLKRWTLVLALVAAVVSLARSLKFTALMVVTLVLGTTLVVAVHPDVWIAFGMVLLLVSIFTLYYRTIASSFRSSFDFFSVSVLAKVWGFVEKAFIVDQGVMDMPVEAMTAIQTQSWTNALGMSVVCNRGCYFLASKLQELRRSRLLAVVYMSRVLVLFAFSLYVFSLVNRGLYRIDPGSFNTVGVPGAFNFVWYTFNSLFGNGVSDMSPVSPIAQALFMATTASSLLILFVVLVFFITTVQSSRDNERMTEMVDDIRAQGRDLDSYLGREFGMSVQEAVDRLRRSKTGVLGLVYFFSPELRPNEDAEPMESSPPSVANVTAESELRTEGPTAAEIHQRDSDG